MNSKIAIGLAMFLSGIGTQIGGFKGGWEEIFTPLFISGVIIQLSGFIITVWGGVEYIPNRDGKFTRQDDINKLQ